MLGFLKNIFTFNSKNKIKYDKRLINHFIKVHKELISIYNNMIKYNEEGDLMKLKQEMKNFQLSINLHILEEDEKLYSYLVQESNGEESKIKMHKKVHDEMTEIVSNISKFLEKYENNLLGANKNNFRKELEKIGEILTDRIEREEKGLYRLYKK